MALTTLIALVFCAVGFGAGYLVRQSWSSKKLGSLEAQAAKKAEEAEVKAKEIIVEAKEKAASILVEGKNEERDRRKEIEALEARVLSREESLDKKSATLTMEESAIRAREEKLRNADAALAEKQKSLQAQLENIAGLSKQQAHEAILKEAKESRSQDLAQTIQKMDQENRDNVEKRSADIITTALQRYARSHVAEITTTLFPLGDEDMKGKIIGREGGIIRALERATGVEFIIDEAPDAIIISSFDPVPPRSSAARAGKIGEGRPNPAGEDRGESGGGKDGTREADARNRRRLRRTDLGIFDLPKELLQFVGRLISARASARTF